MELIENRLLDICHRFQVDGTFLGYEHIKVGNVNQTYSVVFMDENRKRRRYCLQRINTYAFRNPEQLMHNVQLVTEHMHAKEPGGQVIRYEHTVEGRAYIKDHEDIWRMYTYIPAVTYSVAENMDIVYETGRAFGTFQTLLSDFSSDQLYETIPNFHNTPKRLSDLRKDAERDLVGRVSSVRSELDDIYAMSEAASILQTMRDAGELPARVTHNDTKLNNVLFDEHTQKAITVIDLDTVMPGLIAYDFGDAIRFMANLEAEDSRNWESAAVDMDIFRIFTHGFLAELRDVLTQNELDTLSYGPFVLALELASRFLDDYILGDPYFKTDYDDHNLVRTRCQLQLAKDCLRKQPEMARIIREYLGQ